MTKLSKKELDAVMKMFTNSGADGISVDMEGKGSNDHIMVRFWIDTEVVDAIAFLR